MLEALEMPTEILICQPRIAIIVPQTILKFGNYIFDLKYQF